jgi:RluA family pseudouridine synthase
MILTAKVTTEQSALRLDEVAKLLFPQLSKSEIRRVIDLGGCAVNQVMVRVASRQLKAGDEIALGIMEPERFIDVQYAKSDLIFENSDYLAINKASGINSQRTPYQLKGTVEYGVAQYLLESGSKEPARVIHRLDRGTSGVMFFPKNKQAATYISDQLKNSLVSKIYWAVVADQPDAESWRIDAPIAKINKFRYGVALPGKESSTEFRILAKGSGITLVEARPLTGRTHQIRVHLTHCGLPIVGDAPYGGSPAPRMLLHCRSMSFKGRRGESICAAAKPDAMFSSYCAEHGIDIDSITETEESTSCH